MRRRGCILFNVIDASHQGRCGGGLFLWGIIAVDRDSYLRLEMSAGKFETAKYEAISGTIYPCRAQPETKGATIGGVANSYPADAVTAGVSKIALRKGKRAFGPAIRTATLKLTADGAGDKAEYKANTLHVIPIFAEATYDAWTYNQVGTYLGIACELVGIFPAK